MTGDNLVFNAFMVELNRMLCIIASKYKQILHLELVSFGPANFQALLILVFLGIILKVRFVK